MAFQPTLRTLSKHSSDVLTRFLAAPPVSRGPNAFGRYRVEETGRWVPPAISARRQAKLAQQAVLHGKLEQLPKARTTIRYARRLEQREAHQAFEAVAANLRYAPPAPESAAGGTKGAKQRIAAESHVALQTARAEGYKGPYTGRRERKMFKGSKVDRAAVLRKQSVQNKLANMQTTIKDWQTVSTQHACRVEFM